MRPANTPMRILHVVSATNRGGAETLLMNLYRNIDRSTIQFDFVSHHLDACDYDDEIAQRGGRVFRMASLGQLGLSRYMRTLAQIIRAHGPYPVVHAHTDFQGGCVARAACIAGVPKRICHSHSSDWTGGRNILSRISLLLLKAMIRRYATDYCACSEEAARFLFGTDPATIVRNGIDLTPYTDLDDSCRTALRHELQLNCEQPILAHVGRFFQEKNHAFLLQILQALHNEGMAFTAILVGDGPLRPEIETQVRRTGLQQHVRFLGVRSDIPQLLRAADAFLLPSLFEGFGIVMVEAQAAGTPCIASDVVPRVTDMGIGLVRYVSLDARLSAWCSAVRQAIPCGKPRRLSEAHQAIQRHGYDIRTIVPELYTLYQVAR